MAFLKWKWLGRGRPAFEMGDSRELQLIATDDAGNKTTQHADALELVLSRHAAAANMTVIATAGGGNSGSDNQAFLGR